jgi:hypothetical protein
MREPWREERKLTTADLARGQRNPDTDTRARPGPGTREPGGIASPMRETVDRESAPLFAPDEAQRFRSQWDKIQAGFVDEPRPSVEQADALVAAVMKRLADVFAHERANLESQWHRGDQISTEDLRVALRRYRSFFARLLSV